MQNNCSSSSVCLTKHGRAFFSLPVFTLVSDLNVWTFSSLARSLTANPRCNYSFSRMVHLVQFYLISCCDTRIRQLHRTFPQCEEQNVLHFGIFRNEHRWRSALSIVFAHIAVAGCFARVGIISNLPLPHKRQQKGSACFSVQTSVAFISFIGCGLIFTLSDPSAF